MIKGISRILSEMRYNKSELNRYEDERKQNEGKSFKELLIEELDKCEGGDKD